MPLPSRTSRAALTALAVALITAPAAHASTSLGPSMSAADIRTMQAQGVREIIVERKPGVSAADRAALRAQAGVSYLGPGPLPNTELDRAPTGQLSAAVAALARDPQVQYAEPNAEVHAAAAPNDPYFGLQWGLSNTGQSIQGTAGTPGDDIGAAYAWAHASGAGQTVAVVDSGVDWTAPDLQGRLVGGASFINGVQGTDTQDQNGHGTHVSGIIAAAQGNAIGVSGVAPGALLTPLRALGADGSGTLDDVAAAFDYAGQNNFRIVNASLGGTAASQSLEQSIADHPNTLYVVAAGNYGANNDDPQTPFYPCDLPEANLICVGATDQNDQPASFTDYGATSVDLFAPGVNILSTYPGGYAYADGTSMASPMVAGTLALMLQRNPSMTAAQLKSDLLASVDQASQLAGLAATGGELDAAAAVATAGGDSAYAAPANRARPEVSPDPTAAQTLTASPGSWSRLPTGYTYQWERCLVGICLPIVGATGSSYTPSANDLGASFYVVVTAYNAAGSAQAISNAMAMVSLPGAPAAPATSPAGGGATTPAPAPAPTPATGTQPSGPGHRGAVRLTRVAVVGPGSAVRARTLVFTLSARARVQITLAGSSRGHRAAGDALRLSVSGRQGTNRYALTTLLRGHHLPRGRYALTVRAGNRAVTVSLAVG